MTMSDFYGKSFCNLLALFTVATCSDISEVSPLPPQCPTSSPDLGFPDREHFCIADPWQNSTRETFGRRFCSVSYSIRADSHWIFPDEDDEDCATIKYSNGDYKLKIFTEPKTQNSKDSSCVRTRKYHVEVSHMEDSTGRGHPGYTTGPLLLVQVFDDKGSYVSRPIEFTIPLELNWEESKDRHHVTISTDQSAVVELPVWQMRGSDWRFRIFLRVVKGRASPKSRLSVQVCPGDKNASSPCVGVLNRGLENILKDAGEEFIDLTLPYILLATRKTLNLTFTLRQRGEEDDDDDDDELEIEVGLKVLEVSCVTWNEETRGWDRNGCWAIGGTSQASVVDVRCRCSHLSFFTGIVRHRPVPINFTVSLEKLLTAQLNHHTFIMFIIMWLAYSALAVLAISRDRSDQYKARMIDLADNSPFAFHMYVTVVYTGKKLRAGTDAEIFLQFVGTKRKSDPHHLTCSKFKVLQSSQRNLFIIRTLTDLGELTHLRLWVCGSPDSWYLRYIEVLDLQRKKISHFLCDSWLSQDLVRYKTISPAMYHELYNFKPLMSFNVCRAFEDWHNWVSVIFVPIGDNFTRFQRLSRSFCLLLGNLMCTLMFFSTPNYRYEIFGFGNIKLTYDNIVIATYNVILLSPVIALISFLFRYSKHKIKDELVIADWKIEENLQTAAGRSLWWPRESVSPSISLAQTFKSVLVNFSDDQQPSSANHDGKQQREQQQQQQQQQQKSDKITNTKWNWKWNWNWNWNWNKDKAKSVDGNESVGKEGNGNGGGGGGNESQNAGAFISDLSFLDAADDGDAVAADATATASGVLRRPRFGQSRRAAFNLRGHVRHSMFDTPPSRSGDLSIASRNRGGTAHLSKLEARQLKTDRWPEAARVLLDYERMAESEATPRASRKISKYIAKSPGNRYEYTLYEDPWDTYYGTWALYVAWTLTVLLCILFTIIVSFYTITLPWHSYRRWAIASMTSFLLFLVVKDPATVIFLSFIYSSMFKERMVSHLNHIDMVREETQSKLRAITKDEHVAINERRQHEYYKPNKWSEIYQQKLMKRLEWDGGLNHFIYETVFYSTLVCVFLFLSLYLHNPQHLYHKWYYERLFNQLGKRMQLKEDYWLWMLDTVVPAIYDNGNSTTFLTKPPCLHLVPLEMDIVKSSEGAWEFFLQHFGLFDSSTVCLTGRRLHSVRAIEQLLAYQYLNTGSHGVGSSLFLYCSMTDFLINVFFSMRLPLGGGVRFHLIITYVELYMEKGDYFAVISLVFFVSAVLCMCHIFRKMALFGFGNYFCDLWNNFFLLIIGACLGMSIAWWVFIKQWLESRVRVLNNEDFQFHEFYQMKRLLSFPSAILLTIFTWRLLYNLCVLERVNVFFSIVGKSVFMFVVISWYFTIICGIILSIRILRPFREGAVVMAAHMVISFVGNKSRYLDTFNRVDAYVILFQYFVVWLQIWLIKGFCVGFVMRNSNMSRKVPPNVMTRKRYVYYMLSLATCNFFRLGADLRREYILQEAHKAIMMRMKRYSRKKEDASIYGAKIRI